MPTIPIKVKTAVTPIHADRRLVFQVLSAFGSGGMHPGGASSKVLELGENGRLLVEFRTPAKGLFGRKRVFRTVEWVTLSEPDSIAFEGVEGLFAELHDRFDLEIFDGCTRLRYHSVFAIRGWVFGWLVGILYARPKVERFMREHLVEMKATAEARAERSRVFPACGHVDTEDRTRDAA